MEETICRSWCFCGRHKILNVVVMFLLASRRYQVVVSVVRVETSSC